MRSSGECCAVPNDVPAVGWQLQTGVLLTRTAEELADQMIDVNEKPRSADRPGWPGRTAITNADGVPGEVVYINGVDQSALIVTFVVERADDGSATSSARIGVEIEVVGTPNGLEDLVEEIAAMIETTTCRPAGQRRRRCRVNKPPTRSAEAMAGSGGQSPWPTRTGGRMMKLTKGDEDEQLLQAQGEED